MVDITTNKRKLENSESSKGDWLNELPEDVLCKILFNLPTIDSVRTSVLYKSWTNLWSNVSALDLDSDDFQNDYAFAEFMDRFMGPNQNLDLKRFRLIYNVDEHFQPNFASWIDNVVTRGVSHLTVLNNVEEEFVTMPPSLYSCATLVNLTLRNVVMYHPGPGLVSLPCVKTMLLEDVMYDGDAVMETLISSCSILEDLTIITSPYDDNQELVRVRSRSLTRFKLECSDPESRAPNVEINAPKLQCMDISEYHCQSFIIHSIMPASKVNIDVMFDVEFDDPLETTMVRNFLTAISKVCELRVSDRTLELIHGYSELEPLPIFSSLLRLDASFIDSSCELLPTFLGRCPNLHSLALEFDSFPEEIELSFVPQCFLSSLEFVQLKTPITLGDTSSKMKFAEYFLRNCAVLKKMMLGASFTTILKEIQKIPKRSRGCKVASINST